jgi:hypothetical protein
MCVIIATKEELTNNVLASFTDDLVVCDLRGTLNKLFNKCIDALLHVSIVPNLHWMLMSTDMNVGFGRIFFHALRGYRLSGESRIQV